MGKYKHYIIYGVLGILITFLSIDKISKAYNNWRDRVFVEKLQEKGYKLEEDKIKLINERTLVEGEIVNQKKDLDNKDYQKTKKSYEKIPVVINKSITTTSSDSLLLSIWKNRDY